MQERIVEIIVYLVIEFVQINDLHEVDMSSLTRDGYTQNEISKAFSWIFERMIGLKNSIGNNPGRSGFSPAVE